MKYMVGKLEHKMTSTDEDRYRCFVYNEGENKVYDVAQSGDATCNGLPSATEGSRTMKLTKGKTVIIFFTILVTLYFFQLLHQNQGLQSHEMQTSPITMNYTLCP